MRCEETRVLNPVSHTQCWYNKKRTAGLKKAGVQLPHWLECSHCDMAETQPPPSGLKASLKKHLDFMMLNGKMSWTTARSCVRWERNKHEKSYNDFSPELRRTASSSCCCWRENHWASNNKATQKERSESSTPTWVLLPRICSCFQSLRTTAFVLSANFGTEIRDPVFSFRSDFYVCDSKCAAVCVNLLQTWTDTLSFSCWFFALPRNMSESNLQVNTWYTSSIILLIKEKQSNLSYSHQKQKKKICKKYDPLKKDWIEQSITERCMENTYSYMKMCLLSSHIITNKFNTHCKAFWTETLEPV